LQIILTARQTAYDAARVNRQLKALPYQARQRRAPQEWVPLSLLAEKLDDLCGEFVRPARATLSRGQTGKAGLAESGLRLIERRARKSER
jgi:hypothetical protein